jgi:hypothetical protein
MAKKRTKADKLQRSSDRTQKRADAHEDRAKTRNKREDFSQAAARIVREATEK